MTRVGRWVMAFAVAGVPMMWILSPRVYILVALGVAILLLGIELALDESSKDTSMTVTMLAIAGLWPMLAVLLFVLVVYASITRKSPS